MSLSPWTSRPCRNSRALPMASIARRFSSTAIRDGERLHERERDEPRHGDDERRGWPSRTAPSGPSARSGDHAERHEQRHAADRWRRRRAARSARARPNAPSRRGTLRASSCAPPWRARTMPSMRAPSPTKRMTEARRGRHEDDGDRSATMRLRRESSAGRRRRGRRPPALPSPPAPPPPPLEPPLRCRRRTRTARAIGSVRA